MLYYYFGCSSAGGRRGVCFVATSKQATNQPLNQLSCTVVTAFYLSLNIRLTSLRATASSTETAKHLLSTLLVCN